MKEVPCVIGQAMKSDGSEAVGEFSEGRRARKKQEEPPETRRSEGEFSEAKKEEK